MGLSGRRPSEGQYRVIMDNLIVVVMVGVVVGSFGVGVAVTQGVREVGDRR